MLTSPYQAPPHHPHTHSRDASLFTEAQQTQPGALNCRPLPLYGRTRLYGFMALINDYFHRITVPHRHLTFHQGTTNPIRSVGLQNTPLHGRTRLYSFMALINEISRNTASLPPHTFSGRLTFHRGTTNSTRSIGPQDTHPTWTDKALRLCGLN